MLIVSRKPNEAILIGDNIEVYVLEVQGDKVRIGINAPKDVLIIRNELKEVIDQNKESAQSVTVNNLTKLSNMIKKSTNLKNDLNK